jgi:hypothetical protein
VIRQDIVDETSTALAAKRRLGLDNEYGSIDDKRSHVSIQKSVRSTAPPTRTALPDHLKYHVHLKESTTHSVSPWRMV